MKCRHHAEIAAPAANCPEQVRVLIDAGLDHPTVGQDQLGADQVVDGHAKSAAQPAHPAAQGEPAHAGVRDHPGRGHHAVRFASTIRSASNAPPPTLAVRDAKSTSTRRIDPRSSNRPSSQVENPATLCRRRVLPAGSLLQPRSAQRRPRRKSSRVGRSQQACDRPWRSTPPGVDNLGGPVGSSPCQSRAA